MPHNSKCRYGQRGAADAKPKAQAILCAAKVSAASGGYSEPKQGQRSQSARGFCSRSTMRVPQPDIGEHFGNTDAVPQPLERCLSRKAGIMRCCFKAFLPKRRALCKNQSARLLMYCGNYTVLPDAFQPANAAPNASQASASLPSGRPHTITGSFTMAAPAASASSAQSRIHWPSPQP